ncbi:serine hydrolase [Rhodococcus sp. BP22]|uniref:serine hydrolase domain-containing protein n=1 Tax=Rhodococcus sp. BP22 TaxID=2758566 RepID=UPI0016453B62|nr:serine hydrolase domain-containing protein [Rhodococcus sp. BP22]
MAPLRGVCVPRYGEVRKLLQGNMDAGLEVGASLCLIVDGEVEIDLWGGVADIETGREWAQDTVTNTYSLTKTMTALVALLLVERGQLNLDAPVSTYWPEFAAEGKQSVLVRHILGHTSGVCGWEQRVSVTDIYDTQSAASLLAAQAPWWTPGEGSGYQALNHGHLIGEIVRLITGRTLGEVFAEEFAGPMCEDYWIGTPPDIDARVAPLIPPPPSEFDFSALPPEGVFVKTMTNPAMPTSISTDRDFLAAEIGAANGQGNAHSVARLQSLISHDGVVDGRKYLSPSTIERIFEVQADGVDRVLGTHIRFGVGYGLPSPDSMPSIPDGRICWWTGYGGSLVINDLDRRMTMAFVMNKMAPQLVGAPNVNGYLDAVYAAIDN